MLAGTDRDTNLQNYTLMDISLDSWPYCGGNSLAEALWQGVPVITLKGVRATSSYGASLVRAAGLVDLIAETPAQFVEIAMELASDAERLETLRRIIWVLLVAGSILGSLTIYQELTGSYHNTFGGLAMRYNAEIGFGGGTVVFAITSFAVLVPSLGSLGPYHEIGTRALTGLYDVATETALGCVTVLHAIQFVLIGGILGLVVWLLQSLFDAVRDPVNRRSES